MKKKRVKKRQEEVWREGEGEGSPAEMRFRGPAAQREGEQRCGFLQE